MSLLNRLLACASVALACGFTAAAHADDTPHWVHFKLLNTTTTLPKKVVIVPAGVKVFEMTAGDVTEEVPEWSAEASRNVMQALSAAMKGSARPFSSSASSARLRTSRPCVAASSS